MTNLRAQAAAAAMEWCAVHASTAVRDYNGDLAFTEGYLLGHSAGFSEGARAFAEWADNETNYICEDLERPPEQCGVWFTEVLARFLAAAAAPTTNPAPVSSSLVVPDWQSEPPGEDVRESVRWFAAHMERKLRAYDDRPGWIGCDADWLLERMKEERKELTAALRQLAASDGDERTNVLVLRVINEAADVANFAMMIADNARECLPPLPVPAKTGEEEGR